MERICHENEEEMVNWKWNLKTERERENLTENRIYTSRLDWIGFTETLNLKRRRRWIDI